MGERPKTNLKPRWPLRVLRGDPLETRPLTASRYSNAPARCSPPGPAAGEQCSIGSPGTQPGWSCYRPHVKTTRHRGVASHVS